MRIDANARVYTRSGASGAAARSGGGGFRLEGQGQAQRAVATGAPVAAGGIEALLALQAVEDATMGRRKALKRGHALLDSLEDIRADLLVGRVSEGRLNRAIALLQQAKMQAGEELDALTADIELRVRVELAKLGRFPAL